MSDPYTLIKTAVFSSVTDVRFYESVLEHVQEHHPEVPILLPSIYGAVENCIANPTHIEEHSNSFVFVNADSTNWSGDALRIPVRIVEGTSGRIATVFFATPANPNIIWRRS